MASHSPQLEAVLSRFAAQPGVSAGSSAQLRDALRADPDLSKQLDLQARAGQLRDFVVQPPGGTSPNLAGTYDIQTGVVTLPAASLQPTGTTANSDLRAVLQVQQMFVAFAHSTYQDSVRSTHPVTQDMLDNLQSSVNRSPFLAEEIKRSATTIDTSDARNPQRANLQGFGFVGPGVAAGGTYDGNRKIMNLPPLGLQSSSAANPSGRFNPQDMTFVLGHEIQHSFNHASKNPATAKFLTQVEIQSKVKGPVHDYTGELRDYIQAGREDEAKAEIAGWNALLSREKQANPAANGLDVMLATKLDRTLDFVEQDKTSSSLKHCLSLVYPSIKTALFPNRPATSPRWASTTLTGPLNSTRSPASARYTSASIAIKPANSSLLRITPIITAPGLSNRSCRPKIART